MRGHPLHVVAATGSVSYGCLAPERLDAPLFGGAAPEEGDRARLRQAAMEADPNVLAALALSQGLTLLELSARFEQLIGAPLQEVNAWMRGESF
jgi:hypothetical protein